MFFKHGKNFFYFVFFLLNIFLSSYFIYVWDDWNSISRILPVLSFSENGSLAIDKFHSHTGDKSYVGGHYYSDKAPLPSLLIMPVYAVAKKIGLTEIKRDGYNEKTVYFIGSILCASVPFSLILLFCLVYAAKKEDHFSSLIIVMLALYGSFLFVYTGTFYAHLIAAFFLLASYILLKFHAQFFLSGFILGLGFLSEFPIGLALPVWALQLFFNFRSLRTPALFCLGFLPSLIFILIYNYSLSGSAFTMLYHYTANERYTELNRSLGFNLPDLAALWDLLFSQFRGIFFYFPFLLLAIWLAIKHYAFSIKNIARSYLLPLGFCYFLLISSHAVWWGGWVYGPRHLITVVALLGFEGIRILSAHKFPLWIFFTLTTFGLMTSWMAKSTVVFDIIPDILYPIADAVIPEFFSRHFNANNILTMLFDLNPEKSAFIWLCLFIAITFAMNLWYKKLSPNSFFRHKG